MEKIPDQTYEDIAVVLQRVRDSLQEEMEILRVIAKKSLADDKSGAKKLRKIAESLQSSLYEVRELLALDYGIGLEELLF